MLYAAATVALTWPLVPRMAHDIAGDFGDPLLNTWILAWDATHLGRGLWNAGIFHPHPLALAYSEHLLPQAIQILPIYWATKNPVLCYNLLFLSTFVLSGAGMFLLARELTGSRPAALVAGLAFAFAPYRFASVPHLQVLSSAWMPFALFGFRRYFVSGRMRPLIGGSAAWLLQNLSCGYYLLFFSPIVLFYIVWEMTARKRWTDARTVIRVASACAIVALATAPFLLPYLELRRLGFSPRSFAETDKFAADVYAYLTVDPNLRVIGRFVRAWPKGEGSLFPGFTILALAITAVVVGAGRPFHPSADSGCPELVEGQGRRAAALKGPRYVTILIALLIASCVMLVALLFGWTLRLPILKITSVSRTAWVVVSLAVLLLVISAHARATARGWLSHPVGLFSWLTLFAVVMSFGPHIHSKGRLIVDPNLYAFFYNFIPGFDAVRVPARFGMIVALGLAALAGYGVHALETAGVRAAAAIASTLIIVEAFAVPLTINDNSTDYKQSGLAPLPATLALDAHADDLYRFISALPATSAIVELPLGEPAFDVRYMFYSTRHSKPLVNGYSGGEPADYSFLNQTLQDVLTRPDRAWEALVASTATHVVVHEAFYAGDRGPRITAWLRSHGAIEVGTFGRDRVFALAPRHSF